MTSREFIDLRYLGFSHISREDAAHASTSGMHVKHDLGRFFAVHRKEKLQNFDHEIHWSEIVIQNHDLIQRRTRDFGLGGFKCQATLM